MGRDSKIEMAGNIERLGLLPTQFAWRYLVFLLIVLAASGYSPRFGQAAQEQFSPEQWRQAVDAKNPNWSRDTLLKQFVEQYKLDGMDRSRVISLLGQPAISQEHEPRGQYRSRQDFYCLSAKDINSFRIEYDVKDKVKSYFVEATPCKSCGLYIGAAPAAGKFLKIDVLNNSLLQKYGDEQIRQMKISRLEAILGKADKSRTVDSRAGGQLWVNFDYICRLSADGTRVFVVDGHVPRRDWNPNADLRILSWWLITMAPGCREEIPENSSVSGEELRYKSEQEMRQKIPDKENMR